MDNKRKRSFERASFLKVLEDDFARKLPIPAAFTKIFEGEIPPWLILEVAGTRKCWRVDVEQDENGGLYLGYGFDCFVEAHSLEIGNFLLFEHEHPSMLQVKIYEKDGSERQTEMAVKLKYQVRPASESHTQQIPIVHQEEDASPWSSSPWSASHTTTPVHFGSYKKQRGAIGNSGNNRNNCLVSATEHGLHFSLTWREASHFQYYLTIPKAVLVGKTFSNNEEITLKDGEGNFWPIQLRLRADGRVDMVAPGWREFVNDSDLTTGDTLTFEFESKNVIQVQIKRALHVDNPSQAEQDGNLRHAESLNMTCKTEEPWCTPSNSAPLQQQQHSSEFPPRQGFGNSVPLIMDKYETLTCELRSSFSFTWTDRTRNDRLNIPKAIATYQKLVNKDIVVLCDPDGKHWLMEIRTRNSDGRVELGRGWGDFVKSHGVGAGDTLNFEFVTDRMMKVQVVKRLS